MSAAIIRFSDLSGLERKTLEKIALATARDIVLRLPEADEATVRLELSGNLCRCTGYVKVEAAILEAAKRMATP